MWYSVLILCMFSNLWKHNFIFFFCFILVPELSVSSEISFLVCFTSLFTVMLLVLILCWWSLVIWYLRRKVSVAYVYILLICCSEGRTVFLLGPYSESLLLGQDKALLTNGLWLVVYGHRAGYDVMDFPHTRMRCFHSGTPTITPEALVVPYIIHSVI